MAILYLVATPIGNREDITQRALRILAEVYVVFAEDTRHSRQLLNSYGIKAQLRSLHQHNENSRIQEVQDLLDAGHDVALISDAGMPLISDPGQNLVANIRKAGHQVTAIPGASAVLTALAASGLATQTFGFYGFLPEKKSQRSELLRTVKDIQQTLIFFIAIHDLKKYCLEIAEFFPSEKIVIARELTKMHESFYSGTANDLLALIDSDELVLKGEVVLLIDNNSNTTSNKNEYTLDELIKTFIEDIPASKLAKKLASLTGIDRRDIYQKIEDFKNK